MEVNIENKPLIWDADGLLYSCSKENIIESIELMDSIINNTIKAIVGENNSVEVYFVLSQSPYFRHKIYPLYKANRPPSELLWIKTLKSYLKEKYNAFYVPNLEADDIVTYLKQKYPQGVLVSPDKDVLYQNTGKHFNPKKQEFIEVSTIDSHKFLFKQVLMGDSVDNIPGIPGVGEVTANNLLEGIEDYNDLETKVYKIYQDTYKNKKLADYMFKLNFYLVRMLKFKAEINMYLDKNNDVDSYIKKYNFINNLNEIITNNDNNF